MGEAASRPGDYHEPQLPKHVFEVRLSIYTFDLTGVSLLNSLSSNVTGAYHSGLVVAGEEWSFGGHDETGQSGVYNCTPEMNPEYQFYDRIVMGRVRGSLQQVQDVIFQLGRADEWTGPRYQLFENNCNHFCSDLCWALLRRRPPDWINRTAEKCARQNRLKHSKEQVIRLALASYKARLGVAQTEPDSDAAGAIAFKDTYESTFDAAMVHHEKLFKLPEEYADLEATASGEVSQPLDELVDLKRPPEQQDIVALRRDREKEALQVVHQCAKAAAHAVASASRRASTERAKLSEDKKELWDQAWAHASVPLLIQWREEAVHGNLLVDFSEAAAPQSSVGLAQRKREMQVEGCRLFLNLVSHVLGGAQARESVRTDPMVLVCTKAHFDEAFHRIPVAGTTIEAQIHISLQSPIAVIATHPWGPLGGSMADPHPRTVCHTFGNAGCSTVRFNFRSGIGSGSGSVEDVKAVARWLTRPREEAGGRIVASKILIVGYSYGSIIGAAAAAEIPEAFGYAMIGPPLDYGWALYMFNAANLRAKAASSAGKPKLLLVGTNDQFCSMQSFKGFADSVPGPKEMQVLNGSDHFNLFQSLPQALAEWVQRAFGVNMPDFARGAWLGQAEQRNSTPQAAQAAQASPQAPERPQGSPGRRPSGSPKKDKSPR
ncbi:unnamed protein product [Durusdinium trenchii]|uniref:PPPDE domain-containing protein n=1 Tax=Durusdinium trenchii TaxID=1381693 RepID=A0ABP0RFH9_9DINO